MWRILFIVVVILSFGLALTALNNQSLAKEPPTESAAVVEAPLMSTTTQDFAETGTLVFYPNNVGPVPYLFYTDQKGNTVAKALVFPDSPPTNFSSWTGSRISVTGTQVMEHVVVSSISYVSAP